MNKQEYKHIRNLAWGLLITAKISKLPVDVMDIAQIYDLEAEIEDGKTRYENTLSISQHILSIFGYDTSPDSSRHLAVRILAPMIVLKELNVQSVYDAQK